MTVYVYIVVKYQCNKYSKIQGGPITNDTITNLVCSFHIQQIKQTSIDKKIQSLASLYKPLQWPMRVMILNLISVESLVRGQNRENEGQKLDSQTWFNHCLQNIKSIKKIKITKLPFERQFLFEGNKRFLDDFSAERRRFLVAFWYRINQQTHLEMIKYQLSSTLGNYPILVSPPINKNQCYSDL